MNKVIEYLRDEYLDYLGYDSKGSDESYIKWFEEIKIPQLIKRAQQLKGKFKSERIQLMAKIGSLKEDWEVEHENNLHIREAINKFFVDWDDGVEIISSRGVYYYLDKLRDALIDKFQFTHNSVQEEKDNVYKERDMLVGALSKLFPSYVCRHPDEDKTWENDWRWIVCIDLPTGQATWHIHDSEKYLFNHLEVKKNNWDGHSTEEKYQRLNALKKNNRREESRQIAIEKIKRWLMIHTDKTFTKEIWEALAYLNWEEPNASDIAWAENQIAKKMEE